MFFNLFNNLKLAFISDAIFNSAKQSGHFMGQEFGDFGREMGRKLFLKSPGCGLEYFIAPVNSVRYFEFSLVDSHLAQGAFRCLDVSSPRLFSLYQANKNPNATIHIINPDNNDFKTTKNIIEKLNYKNITAENIDLKKVDPDEKYDCIWSISVIEHISGDYDDTEAIKMMYSLLKPGGKLIITFPVDRVFRNEYRANNAYGLAVDQMDEKYFFQRHYDYASIVSRLLQPIGTTKVEMRWFGENSPGYFEKYESEWQKNGLKHLVNDPIEIIRNFSEYPSWEAMPGMGVCGLMLEKIAA